VKKLKFFALSALILLLFIEIWLGFPISLERGAEEPVVQNKTASPTTDKRMEGIHMVESRSGNRDWELFAENAEGTEGESSWELNNVKVLFYSDDKIEFTVAGKQGKIDAKSKDMKITGQVITQSRNGYRFSTNTLSYLNSQRMMKSSDKVYMSGPPDRYGKGMVVEGDWLEAYIDTNTMKILNRVVAKKQLNDGKKFLVHSGTAEFSGKTKAVKFLEQVAIELDSMRMEGPEAQFQYKESADMLQTVMLKGGVKVSDLEKYATSESVKFDPAENRFTLSGNPRVVQDNDEISGEKIEFIDGGKKVKVEKMKARVEKLEE
jgi:LPS export ABC transporter protein LptC